MTEERQKALEKVRPLIEKIGPYSVVSADNAIELLGEDRFLALTKDRLRSASPKNGYFYYWNVVDYVYDSGVYKKEKS